MSGRLEGKVALVSGGARGLGEAIVELFAEEGAAVVFGDVLDEAGEKVAIRLKQLGAPVTYTNLDVTRPDDWAAAVALTTEKYGRLTTLVNNAAVYDSAGLMAITPEAWSKLLSVNLDGQWLGMRAAEPALLTAGKGAAIVNVCSLWANIGSPGSVAYHASKGGVRSMTKSVALEYAERGIRVNSLHPGMIDTEFGGSTVMREDLDKQMAVVPMKRMGAPIEIAYGALFLASDEARYMTGAELIVDGGWSVP
ncbi:SDR family NAD(P)-dependent oxidoreductase [Amycolatopsis jiangsuensis]|uniref:NAD(P)-dependent dehydrogenase (Short-subunit alcohol dehydrogenase family) n=1 Tax=Amycolatopsis jiangsuensis TaxID=1181879 RepID=A0A840J819_9PSEU|nr:glucose 1-dehydrogenase [Amycolatopsis jiangsuensis]MBB4689614.1 NAD(P)-dependent dehydrogenase (short-subunit alcohol dehydrogenase family) [Amycolatopsis jiangsuensis]